MVRGMKQTLQLSQQWLGKECCYKAQTQAVAYLMNLCTLYLWSVRGESESNPVLESYSGLSTTCANVVTLPFKAKLKRHETFPTISVVVPSFNQAKYLELTLRSILDQDYPELELIVIDGGSKDESPEIIRRYEQHMKFWCSEPDGGQTQGIIKGFSHATGEILCFLNSDDLFESGVLLEVGEYFSTHPNVDAVYGDALWIDAEGSALQPKKEIPFSRFIWLYTYNYIPGMSMFWRTDNL